MAKNDLDITIDRLLKGNIKEAKESFHSYILSESGKTYNEIEEKQLNEKGMLKKLAAKKEADKKDKEC